MNWNKSLGDTQVSEASHKAAIFPALKEEELHDFNLSEPSQEQDPFDAYGSKSHRMIGSQQLPQMPMSIDDLNTKQKSARNGFAFGQGLA